MLIIKSLHLINLHFWTYLVRPTSSAVIRHENGAFNVDGKNLENRADDITIIT